MSWARGPTLSKLIQLAFFLAFFPPGEHGYQGRDHDLPHLLPLWSVLFSAHGNHASVARGHGVVEFFFGCQTLSESQWRNTGSQKALFMPNWNRLRSQFEKMWSRTLKDAIKKSFQQKRAVMYSTGKCKQEWISKNCPLDFFNQMFSFCCFVLLPCVMV